MTVYCDYVRNCHCCSEGFPEERIKAVLHQIELRLKHQSSSFGLSLISVSLLYLICCVSPTTYGTLSH